MNLKSTHVHKIRSRQRTCTLFAMELSRFLFLMALHHKTFACFDDFSFCLFFFQRNGLHAKTMFIFHIVKNVTVFMIVVGLSHRIITMLVMKNIVVSFH